MDDKLLDITQGKDLVNTSYLRIPIVSTKSAGLCPPLPKNPQVDFTYALTIDSTNSDPEKAVTYIDKLSGHASGWDAWKNDKLFNEIKPCVLQNGEVKYYLQKDDYTKKEDGSPSNLDGSDGDVMIQIPLLGYYFHYEGDILHIELTNKPNKENFCYYAHSLDNPGDCDYIYIGAYLLSGTDTEVKTVSNQTPRRDIGLDDFRKYSNNKGIGYQILSWYVWVLMQVLYLFVFKNLDSQTALGKGYTASGNSATVMTGQTNATGFCSNAGNNGTDGKHQVKCLGIEDFWGNGYQWCDGIIYYPSGGDRSISFQYNNFGTSGPRQHGSIHADDIGAAGYIKKAAGNNIMAFLPNDAANISEYSNSLYFCDYCEVGVYYEGGDTITIAGRYIGGDKAGVFCYKMPVYDSYKDYTAREVYKHKAV